MMAPEEQEEVGGERDAPKAPAAATVDNQEELLETETGGARRARAQSDAARRNERESQRAATHEHKTRLSVLNNRFLARKESRAKSGGGDKRDGKGTGGDGGGSSPTRKPRKQKPERQPEEDDVGDDDDSDRKPVRRVVEESALVVTRRRSSAAASVASAATDKSKPKSKRGAHDGDVSPRGGIDRGVVVAPSVHVVPAVALKRSKWTRELDEDAACGLYVHDERSELGQVASSTLVRLEERLQRERAAARGDREARASLLRLNDLLHVPHIEHHSHGAIAKVGGSGIQPYEAPLRGTQRRRGRPWTTAMLEITIDRLILDDHVSFSLADRVETQLRSLFVSYTHLIHAQPWGPLLQRVDAFVEAQLVPREPGGPTDERQRWLAQTLLDAQTLVQSLNTLQQLHYQLLTKWHELQDCYRQPSLSARVAKLRLRQEKRATSLELTSLRAFLELDDDGGKIDQMRTKLVRRLDELETKDQYLHVVLALETAAADFPTTNSSADRKGLLSRPLVPASPTCYVALFINDKEVGRTKPASWSSASRPAKHKTGAVGVVPIHESLRTQLHFYPDSVTVKVFERGLLMDTLLSTTSIPLVVPGHDLVGSSGSSDVRNRVPAASLAPTSEWYQFSSVNAIPRSRWHATFLNSTLFATFQRHPHGRVRVQVAWVAPDSSRLTFPAQSVKDNQLEDDAEEESTHVVLPPRRLPAAARENAKLVGPRVDRRRLYQCSEEDEHFGGRGQDTRHAGFSYERDFLVHIEDTNNQLTVDRNDPQNAAVVRLQHHVRAQSTLLKHRDVFRADSLVYDATLLTGTPSFSAGRSALTRRNLLLQLRDREHVAKHGTSMLLADASQDLTGKKWDHDAFDEPLPLSEHAIATNVKFLSLLRPEMPAIDFRQRLGDALAVDGSSAFSLERERKLQLLKLQDFVDRVRASKVARVHNKALAGSSKQRDRTKTLATIIQEQPMPLLPGAIDFSGLGTLFSRRRRLRPRVETRSAPATMADWPRHCMLYVQIKGATNVPVRVATGRSKPLGQPTAPSRGKRSTRGLGGGATDDEDDEHEAQRQQRGDNQADDMGATAASPAESSHVFIEIVFQGRRRRTTSTHVRATGAVWMETVALPFNAPQEDWSPDSLQKVQDVVRLSLFDQLVRTSSVDGGDDAFLMLSREANDAEGTRDDHVQQQRTQSLHQENRFLGILEIPFATLYHNHGVLDATLRCEMPVVNVGYVNAKQTMSGKGDVADDAPSATAGAASLEADRDDDLVLQSSREATFLSVMMTLDPLLPRPVKSFEENPLSAGDDYAALAAYASQWKTSTQQLNNATKHRDFNVFVRSLGHGLTFLTRYLAAQIPPPLLESSNGRPPQFSVAQLVRFVRLIPFLEDWQLFDDGGELDVWTTSQELLELNAGDFEEHAVLLCNYFNWLDRDEINRRSFLVLTIAVPEGKTVYVLRQDSYKIPQRSVLWNASTGVGYSVLDDRCPVLDISLVISSENIYANIQSKKRLSEMNWDVESNTKAWKPFFHGTHKKEQFTLPAVQSTQLVYQETPQEYVQQVEGELRETLKLEIRRWRSIKFTTTFNMDLSMKLRAQLERLELAKLQGEQESGRERKTRKEDKESTNKDPLMELLKTRRVSGMPLNTNFTDVSKVISMVKNTNIYWNDNAEVEFGLAVYVHAYPNCVLSVWVYLVAVEPIE